MNRLEYKILAKTENVSLSRNIASAFLLQYDLVLSVQNEVITIISEAVTNSIVHGYLFDESKPIDIILEYNDGLLSIEITDYGIGIIDIEQAMTPMFTTKEDSERSGLGFTIMEVFSNNLEITSNLDKGTTVKCNKYIDANINDVEYLMDDVKEEAA